MDGDQLLKLTLRDQCLREHFRGIFARDQVPSCLMPGFFIWNTDLYSGKGKHWVAIYVTDTHKVEFFDSFAHSPQFYGWDISQYVLFNQKPLQSPVSDVCGMYCIFYLFFRCRGLTMDSILTNFTNNFRKNDAFVSQFLHLLQ